VGTIMNRLSVKNAVFLDVMGVTLYNSPAFRRERGAFIFRQISTRLHGVIFQNRVLFIVNALRTSCLTLTYDSGLHNLVISHQF
jgi:hypothetical protein